MTLLERNKFVLGGTLYEQSPGRAPKPQPCHEGLSRALGTLFWERGVFLLWELLAGCSYWSLISLLYVNLYRSKVEPMRSVLSSLWAMMRSAGVWAHEC